jgi:hypothetical protein
MPFGAEFRCDHCGVTSVLIIDRALVPLSTLQKQGEKVCIECGRMELREARFCQEDIRWSENASGVARMSQSIISDAISANLERRSTTTQGLSRDG